MLKERKSRFQSFCDDGDPKQCQPRLERLREVLSQCDVQGFIVPRADAHQNEYVAPCDERLAYLTGFAGSAGAAVALMDKAAIFVDGRYTLQVREQTDPDIFHPFDSAQTAPAAWLKTNVREGDKIGFDPWLHTPAQIKIFSENLRETGAELCALENNPIDAVWSERPAPPCAPIYAYGEKYSGESAERKLQRICEAMTDDALFVSDPHELAWTFNLRGADVRYTPLPLGWALLRKNARPTLYVEPAKISDDLRSTLKSFAEIAAPARIEADLSAAGKQGARFAFDAATVPFKLVGAFEAAGGKARLAPSPIALMKAVKNKAEILGARKAHLRDGAAMTNFLSYFSANARALNEISAAEMLEQCRAQTGALKDLSFPTISAFGAHGASPHYRVAEKTNTPIKSGVFLIDSGAQYCDGTTDVTRTLAVGRPKRETRDRFTRVLKGHIAIAAAVFPVGTSGAQIDAFARRALWEAGLDFDHGVGHGVGAFLSVHEGPQRISKLGTVALQPGMILSNEPGYYKAGAYGIRIENLLLVETRAIKGAERPMLGFEVLTFVPIDLDLVEPSLMTKDEIAWLNAYHREVRARLDKRVASETRTFLRRATRKISKT